METFTKKQTQFSSSLFKIKELFYEALALLLKPGCVQNNTDYAVYFMTATTSKEKDTDNKLSVLWSKAMSEASFHGIFKEM